MILALLLAATCYIDGGLPSPECTPGQATDATLAQICNRRTKTVRHVSEKTKLLVAQLYGTPEGELVECDHLIALELGGSNALINLWPQPETPWPGFRQKDALEDRLHSLVCKGKMSLEDAQKEIARDWVELYYRLFPSPP